MFSLVCQHNQVTKIWTEELFCSLILMSASYCSLCVCSETTKGRSPKCECADGKSASVFFFSTRESDADPEFWSGGPAEF